MKRFERVDLSPWLNHKLVYASLPLAEEEYGLENICILQANFSLRDEETIDGVEFRFADSNFDNVLCDRQRVKAEAEAKKLHLSDFRIGGILAKISPSSAGTAAKKRCALPSPIGRMAGMRIFSRILCFSTAPSVPRKFFSPRAR